MIKEFLISLAVFDIMIENNLSYCNPTDFLDLKRLNPYYWILKKGVKR